MFKFKTASIAQKFYSLMAAMDGTEPCSQPEFLENPREFTGDITADKYTGNWASSSNIKAETAEKLCEGCPLLEQCREYAMEAQEPYGIWGGTRPVDRGIPRAIRNGKLWEGEE